MKQPITKQIEVKIMGQSYLLSCPLGGETALLDAVAKVDTAMCRIRDASKVKARERIAVLVSLNLAFELSQKESGTQDQTSAGTVETVPLSAMAAGAPLALNDIGSQRRAQELLRRLDEALIRDGQLI